jgi:hypothetical protein
MAKRLRPSHPRSRTQSQALPSKRGRADARTLHSTASMDKADDHGNAGRAGPSALVGFLLILGLARQQSGRDYNLLTELFPAHRCDGAIRLRR